MTTTQDAYGEQALAFVLLGRPTVPPESAVSDALRHSGGGRIVESDREVIMIDAGGSRGFVALMPAAVPGDEVAVACSASLLWPDAWGAVRGHTAHWIVSLTIPLEAPTVGWLRFTHLVARLAQADAVLGVYWGSAAFRAP